MSLDASKSAMTGDWVGEQWRLVQQESWRVEQAADAGTDTVHASEF